jgi:hypothetical protein
MQGEAPGERVARIGELRVNCFLRVYFKPPVAF